MKSLALILAFLPLVVFSLLARFLPHGYLGIAGLVRDGLTNREIGTRLFVSPRTVQTHVSHILQKTGLRSRVEIARFAGA